MECKACKAACKATDIRYWGEMVSVKCDGKCHLSRGDKCTSEGGDRYDSKAYKRFPTKWCVRQCDRCKITKKKGLACGHEWVYTDEWENDRKCTICGMEQMAVRNWITLPQKSRTVGGSSDYIRERKITAPGWYPPKEIAREIMKV